MPKEAPPPNKPVESPVLEKDLADTSQKDEGSAEESKERAFEQALDKVLPDGIIPKDTPKPQ